MKHIIISWFINYSCSRVHVVGQYPLLVCCYGVLIVRAAVHRYLWLWISYCQQMVSLWSEVRKLLHALTLITAFCVSVVGRRNNQNSLQKSIRSTDFVHCKEVVHFRKCVGPLKIFRRPKIFI